MNDTIPNYDEKKEAYFIVESLREYLGNAIFLWKKEKPFDFPAWIDDFAQRYKTKEWDYGRGKHDKAFLNKHKVHCPTCGQVASTGRGYNYCVNCDGN